MVLWLDTCGLGVVLVLDNVVSITNPVCHTVHAAQEDQKVAWLKDDQDHRLSSLEKDCQQKEALITHLYHQLSTIQQQQQQQQQHGSDAAKLVYPAAEMSGIDAAGQKMMHLEREVVAKRLEVEELRAQVNSLLRLLLVIN